jgi:ferredoxin
MSGFLPGQELFDEYAISPNPEASWASIFNWLDNLNRLGCEYKRKLIIKLPFRSDLLKICAHIDKLYKDNLNFTQEPPIEEIVKVKNIVNKDTENNPKISMNTHSVHGIVGVTLINTIKSPFTRLGEKGLWLKGENGDKMKVQQLSGRSLGGLRDWAIFAIKSTYGGLFISASGGIMDENDALGAVKLGADTVQIGTAFLIGGFPAAMRITDGFYNSHYKKMSLMQKEPEDYKRYYINVMTGIEKKNFPPREVEFNKHLCTRCGRCMQSHYCDAFINKYQSISIYPNVSNVDCCKRYNTTQCKAIKTCRQGALKHKNKKIELDRTKCKLCYECVADCEGNALKYKTMIEPVIEKTNCTGCGLCVQICESGALQIRYTKEL